MVRHDPTRGQENEGGGAWMRVWPAKEVKKGHFKLTADVRAARAGRSRRASKDVRGAARGVDVSGSELSKSDSPKRGGAGEVGAGVKSGGGGNRGDAEMGL